MEAIDLAVDSLVHQVKASRNLEVMEVKDTHNDTDDVLSNHSGGGCSCGSDHGDVGGDASNGDGGSCGSCDFDS